MNESLTELRIIRLHHQKHPSTKPIVITKSLIVHLDLTWMVHIHSQMVNPIQCSTLFDIPSTLTFDTFKVLLSLIMSHNVCAGNPDANFVKMAELRTGKFLSPNKELVCYLDNHCVTMDGNLYPCTVRHTKCELLVKEVSCAECHKYHCNLRAMHSSYTRKKNSVLTSTTNLRYMRSPQKRARMLRMKEVLHNKERQIQRWKKRFKNLTEKHGVEVTKELEDDFKSIIKSHDGEMKKLPVQNFKRVFWDQQVS